MALRTVRLKPPRTFNRRHRGLRTTSLFIVLLVAGALHSVVGNAQAEGVEGSGDYRLLVVPVVPADLYNASLGRPDPALVSPWYEANGSEWFPGVARRLEDYYDRITYGRIRLEVHTLPWQPLPRALGDYGSRRELPMEDGLRLAAEKRRLEYYDLIAFVGATSPADRRFERLWEDAPGWGWFRPSCRQGAGCIHTGVFYPVGEAPGDAQLLLQRVLAHEVGHAIELKRYGRYVLPTHNVGGPFSLMGPALPVETLLSPGEEQWLLGAPTPRAAAGAFHLEPREFGTGRGLRFIGPPGGPARGPAGTVPISVPGGGREEGSCRDGTYVIEYRLTLAPPLMDRPGVILWCDRGLQMAPEHILSGPGRYRGLTRFGEVDILISSMTPEAVTGSIELAGAS